MPRNPEENFTPCRPKVTLSHLETKEKDTPLLPTLSIVCGETRNLRQKRHCIISMNAGSYHRQFVVNIFKRVGYRFHIAVIVPIHPDIDPVPETSG